MERPDFAQHDLSGLADQDLRFLIDNFPEPGQSYEQIASVIHQFPSTLDSMLDSDFVYHKIQDRQTLLLNISPFLLFNVLLRRTISGRRTAIDRSVINYLANLLSLFVRADRVSRLHENDHQSYEYLVELIEEATYGDSRRQFLAYAHIGNYSLYLTGLFSRWIEYRHRFRRRPVDASYYTNMGRSYFEQASAHPLATEFHLEDVFLHLALMFDFYKAALNQLANRFLTP